MALRTNRNFMKLATALGVSSVGDDVRIVALPLLGAAFTDNPLYISLLVVANRLPWILFTLTSGFLADRFSRKHLMVGVDVVRGVLVAGFAVCVYFRLSSILILYVVAFCLGIGETIFSAANQGMLPDVVDKQDLGGANGTVFTIQSVVSNFLGPALGGFLFSLARWVPFLIDAISFFAAATLVSRIRGTGGTGGSPNRMMEAIKQGLAWCWTRRVIVALLSVMAVMNLAQSAILSVLVLYVTDDLGLDSTWYGMIIAVAGVGAVLGGVMGPVVERTLGFERVFRLAVALAIPILAVMAVVRSPWALAGALFLNSFIGLLVSVMVATIRQRVVPSALAGRVASVQSFAAMGLALPLGALLGGLIGSAFGLRSVFIFALIICCLLTVLTARVLSPKRLAIDLALLGDGEPRGDPA